LDIGNFDENGFVENPSAPKEIFNYLSWFYSQVAGGGVTQFYEVTLPAGFSYEALFDCISYMDQKIHWRLREVHATFPLELLEIPRETSVPVLLSDWALGRIPGSERTKMLLDPLDSRAGDILPALEYQMTLLAISDVDSFPKLKRVWKRLNLGYGLIH
jgi:hypothetical protein